MENPATGEGDRPDPLMDNRSTGWIRGELRPSTEADH